MQTLSVTRKPNAANWGFLQVRPHGIVGSNYPRRAGFVLTEINADLAIISRSFRRIPVSTLLHLIVYPMCGCNYLRFLELQGVSVSLSESHMHTEQQIQPAVTAPEIAPQAESKSKRGGKRPGAGRKPNLAKRLLKGFTRDVIALAVQEVDVGAVIVGLLKSKRERTRLETLVFVRDTLHGRPAQNVQLSGGVLHAHTAWPLMAFAALSEEEAMQLDALTKKVFAPVSNPSPDGPHNQIESKPAIEVEVMESDSTRG